MFFPIGDDNPSGKRPWVTWGLIGANVLAFVIANGFPFRSLGGVLPMPLARDFGLVPARVAEHPLTFLSSMFLHGDLIHLLGNMVFLWIAGDNVEDKLGRLPYLGFYLLSGVFASVTYLLYAGGSHTPLVGASGAIAGVLGCYMIFFPRARIRIFYWLYFFVGTFYIEARWFLGFWIAENLFMWMVVAGSLVTGVAYAAHAGGFAVGVGVAALLRGRLRRGGVTAADRHTGFAGSGDRFDRRLPGGVVAPETNREFVNPRAETTRDGEGFFGLEEAVTENVRAERMEAALDRYADYLRLPHAKPLPAWAQIEIAAEFYRRGNYEEALKAYRRYLALHSSGADAAEAKFRLGIILARHRREYFRAREYLLQAHLEHQDSEIREHARAELARIEPLL